MASLRSLCAPERTYTSGCDVDAPMIRVAHDGRGRIGA